MASFWIDNPPREGFTEFCAAQLHVPIPVEDVTAGEARIIQQRRDVLATVIGLQTATSNPALRQAEAN